MHEQGPPVTSSPKVAEPLAGSTVTDIGSVMGLMSLRTEDSSTHTSTVESSSDVSNTACVYWQVAIAERTEGKKVILVEGGMYLTTVW